MLSLSVLSRHFPMICMVYFLLCLYICRFSFLSWHFSLFSTNSLKVFFFLNFASDFFQSKANDFFLVLVINFPSSTLMNVIVYSLPNYFAYNICKLACHILFFTFALSNITILKEHHCSECST